jgi:hypothetical protein
MPKPISSSMAAFEPKSGMPIKGFYQIVGNRIVVNLGAMRHQVTLLQAGPSNPPVFDAAGQVQTFSAVLTNVAAAIEMLRGTDVIKGGLQTSILYLQIMIWFQEAINVLPSMRVMQQHNGSQYIIRSIENVLGLDQILILNCEGLGANT